ncbi:MAG: lysostaphin resistance A-like protein, partial [Oscillospiraceae bacterium]
RSLYTLFLTALSFFPPAVFLIRQGRPLGLRMPRSKAALPLSVLFPVFVTLTLLTNGVVNLLYALLTPALSLPPPQMPAFPSGFWSWVLYLLFTCVAAAFFEEFFFRGAVQGLLRSWGPRFAILVTTIVFTLMHGNLATLPTVFVLSLLLGYCAEASGSLRACVLLHAANNLLAVAFNFIQNKVGINIYYFIILSVLLIFVLWSLLALRSAAKRGRLAAWRLKKDAPSLSGAQSRLLRLLKVPLFTLALLCQLVLFIANTLVS